jgi:hypothetical protein
MNLAINERPMAQNQPRQSKLFVPYQQHNASMHDPFNVFLCRAEVCAQHIDTLTPTVLRATDQLNISLSRIYPTPHSDSRGASST